MEETALFSGKIYTADKTFTRPPVATVATNSKSAKKSLKILKCKVCFLKVDFAQAEESQQESTY